MTGYPNREHANADESARRRALAALDRLIDEATRMRKRVDAGETVFGEDAQRFAHWAADLSREFTILSTLADVREWHALDEPS